MIENPAASLAHEILEQRGLDPTLNRILVLSAMIVSPRPLTAAEVYKKVLAEHKLNRVTVYRILDLFEEHGVVSKISSGERSFRYCARPGRRPHGHCHFHCTRCGAVQCIEKTLLPFDEKELTDRLPMDVQNIELRLDGVCESCRGVKATIKENES